MQIFEYLYIKLIYNKKFKFVAFFGKYLLCMDILKTYNIRVVGCIMK